MKHYLFEILDGEYEGEEFIVGADNFHAAIKIAREVGDGADVHYCRELTEFEAENSGLDEY
jgi:hypothetical protein